MLCALPRFHGFVRLRARSAPEQESLTSAHEIQLVPEYGEILM